MKNLEILISESFFLGLASLEETRQGISRSISLFLTIIDLKVVSRELLSLAVKGDSVYNETALALWDAQRDWRRYLARRLREQN